MSDRKSKDEDDRSPEGRGEGPNSPEGEKGGDGDASQEKDESPPQPVGFWHSSLRHVRIEAMWKWLLTTVVLMIFILGVLSLYWGAFFHVDKNISSLVVYVVDFDGQAPYDNTGHQPFVGRTVSQVALQQLKSSSHLGWGTLPASDFNNDPMEVRKAVYDFKAWAAIIINPNATALLYSAIENGNSSYDPRGACQLVFMDSRDDTNWYDFIGPLVNEFMTEATSQVGEEWARIAVQQASNATILNNLQGVPQALSPAIGFSQYNLRPFYPYTIIPSITVALIYLIIVSFFSFSFYLPIHKKYITPEGHPPMHFYQFIIWRYLTTLLAYFFISLAYSLVSLAFLINFSGYPGGTSPTEPTQIKYGNPDAYEKGTFMVYWMLNWFGMTSFGLASENIAMLIGQPWTGLWLIFWVITNVSTAFYDIDIEPSFYNWGYAWPLHQVVEGTRQILFGLHSRIGLNFGILCAWIAISSVLFPFCCHIMRIKTKKRVHEYWA